VRPRPEGPHAILLVTLDTTRVDHLSTYGYSRATSPTLDRIAGGGVRFDGVVTPMPTTDPSHMSLFTGLHPRSHGIWQNGEELGEPETPNLARWAQELGYQTAAFISRAHLLPSALGLRGFDHEDGPKEHSRPAADTTDRAVAWLEDNAERPFFLWLHLFDAHFPYEPPGEFAERYVDAGAPAPVREKWYTRPHTAAMVKVLVGLYDGEIAYADAELGRFLARVRERLPEGEPPLLVVAGDHGETHAELEPRILYSFAHGKYLYQGNLRVPLVLEWPGELPAGRVVGGAAGLTDVPATLFDLVGAPGFPTQGESLVPRIRGRASDAAPLAITQRRSGLADSIIERTGAEEQFAVQDERWKLIASIPSGQVELFDLAEDPGETENLAAAMPAERDRLQAALASWLASTPVAKSRVAEIPEEKIEALRALGYIE
jgi:arylsulfatase A-like enzyme